MLFRGYSFFFCISDLGRFVVCFRLFVFRFLVVLLLCVEYLLCVLYYVELGVESRRYFCFREVVLV